MPDRRITDLTPLSNADAVDDDLIPIADISVPETKSITKAELLADVTLTGQGVTASAAELNILDGATVSTAELNILDGVTASAAELNILDGVTATTSQLNGVQQLSGRNLIINGSGRINQRGYVSGTTTTGANEFTLDRWFVVTSGQSLSFTGDDSRRVMTAPAGGVRQVIESENVIGGSYVLNWDGTATATVNGTSRTKGEVFTLTANTNVVVAFASGTFTDVQLEAGAIATPFEFRPYARELSLCQRYYETGTYSFTGYQSNASGFGVRTRFSQTKAISPSISLSGATFTNASSFSTNGVSTQDFGLLAVASSTGVVVSSVSWVASAEITS